MIKGVGVDLVEVERIKGILDRWGAAATRRLFTDTEVDYCEAMARPEEHYAARVAAKEATVKALGTGFCRGIGFRDVSVIRDATGRPQLELSGGAFQAAQDLGVSELWVSLTHTRQMAMAQVVAVGEETSDV